MVVTYTKGPNCKVFQDGTGAVLVYDNSNGTIQICISSKRLERQPYVIIPKVLCKEVGLELYELGCKHA